MACLINPISQPSLDISPIWIPRISSGLASRREDQHDLPTHYEELIFCCHKVTSFTCDQNHGIECQVMVLEALHWRKEQ
jgi:hypothetical protein